VPGAIAVALPAGCRLSRSWAAGSMGWLFAVAVAVAVARTLCVGARDAIVPILDEDHHQHWHK